MGLFSEACPVCGGEGLFLVRIGDKRALCKSCSGQVSMSKDLLEAATPEFIKGHLEDRRKQGEPCGLLPPEAGHRRPLLEAHRFEAFVHHQPAQRHRRLRGRDAVCQAIKDIIRKQPVRYGY